MFWAGWGENMRERASKYEHFASSTLPRAAIWGRFLQKDTIDKNRHVVRKNICLQKWPRSVWEWSGGVPDLLGPIFMPFLLKSFANRQPIPLTATKVTFVFLPLTASGNYKHYCGYVLVYVAMSMLRFDPLCTMTQSLKPCQGLRMCYWLRFFPK